MLENFGSPEPDSNQGAQSAPPHLDAVGSALRPVRRAPFCEFWYNSAKVGLGSRSFALLSRTILFDVISKPVISSSNRKQLSFGFLIIQQFGYGTSFFSTLAPILGIVDVGM